jgi:ribulose-5-phosphate 4-epimerase/fuculose-1-phosphate aldolase
LLTKIRKHRKDIFLVAFKTTAGNSEGEQYLAGLNLLKANSCNMVLANDIVTRMNMIIVPEEARYCVTTDRTKVLETLVQMTMARASLHFTRSVVVEGETVDWNGPDVPDSLRTVVNHCIEKGAYKPFRGSTAGHFAYKVDDQTFITSKRKTNYNNLDQVGLVKVVSRGPDEVIAYGAKPSVGGQSQRIVFAEHQDVDCIVHFHCPPLPGVNVSTRPQQMLECGSHECGKNTSDGLAIIEPGIKAVFLDEHGPNIAFNRNIDPALVMDFIDRHFDLSAKTGGLVA